MFAEMTQEVEIARSTPLATPQGRTGRGNMYREAVRRAMEHGCKLLCFFYKLMFKRKNYTLTLDEK